MWNEKKLQDIQDIQTTDNTMTKVNPILLVIRLNVKN
jgi:hypothetical protein